MVDDYAMYLDGNTSIKLDSGNISGNFTISMWVRIMSFENSPHFFSCMNETYEHYFNWYLSLGNSFVFVELKNDALAWKKSVKN